MEHLTDHALLAGCISGNRLTEETFVKQFSNLVYTSVQYILRARNISYCRSDIEDLHNTIFVKLFERRCKKLRQYKGKNGCSLSSWIRLIAIRTVLDHIRKERTDALNWKERVLLLDPFINIESKTPEIWTQINKAQQLSLIREGLRSLLPRDRLFIKLHCLEGLSISEVAGMLKISEGNAYSLKHRAIKRLKIKIDLATEDITL
ncbi:MAG: sigma-70 family RNA polymerase sigma factor [Thermodesulfobacteriota bacterium]|nr:sigma-70 family RNA polymerase sigma factor [Thermodesulfobacteriota bacterium]